MKFNSAKQLILVGVERSFFLAADGIILFYQWIRQNQVRGFILSLLCVLSKSSLYSKIPCNPDSRRGRIFGESIEIKTMARVIISFFIKSFL